MASGIRLSPQKMTVFQAVTVCPSPKRETASNAPWKPFVQVLLVELITEHCRPLGPGALPAPIRSVLRSGRVRSGNLAPGPPYGGHTLHDTTTRLHQVSAARSHRRSSTPL